MRLRRLQGVVLALSRCLALHAAAHAGTNIRTRTFIEAADHENQFIHRHSKQTTIREASELLASVGVADLCHPYRDDIPGFPRCENVATSNKLNHRRLTSQDDNKKSNWFYIRNGIGAGICVIVGALSSGLTVGLLSLDPLLLTIKTRAGNTETERVHAEKLLPIIKQRHLLLVTLLLINVSAGEALPMFLNDMVTEVVAVVFSVILVLFAGEILPSAIFAGPRQLEIAARLSSPVKFLMIVLYPIVYPIARLLDYVIATNGGQDEARAAGTFYDRGELAALVRIQYEEIQAAKHKRKQAIRDESIAAIRQDVGSGEEPQVESMHTLMKEPVRELRKKFPRRNSIHSEEVAMVEGALQMKTTAAIDILVSVHEIYSISMDTVLNEKNIIRIFSSGYSRVPVYEGKKKTRIKGILMSRQLILVNSGDKCPVSRLPMFVPYCVACDTDLVALMNLFQTGGGSNRIAHMALVCARPDIGNRALEEDEALPDEAGLMGIITLEDVLEALLQEQILDEMDAAGRITVKSSEDHSTVTSFGSPHNADEVGVYQHMA